MKIGIVGSGVAGLFTAWYLLQREPGLDITIFSKGKPEDRTSHWAAGMLAPTNELEFNELELLKAGIASRNLYTEVEQALPDIGLDKSGTLEVGLNADDTAYLHRFYTYQKEQGLAVEWLSGQEARKLEPLLAHYIPQAIWSPEDIQVDNRKLLVALQKELALRGVCFQWGIEVLELDHNPHPVVVSTAGKTALDKVIFANGVFPLPAIEMPFQVYPIRGEMIELEPPALGKLQKTVRIRNKVLGQAYIVPKSDRIIIGATSEEKGFEQTNTAGGLLDILRKAYAGVPGLYEWKVRQIHAAFRPATLNRQPIIDKDMEKEVFYVNGLYRHGILLGPLAGKATAQLILDGTRLPAIETFQIPHSRA